MACVDATYVLNSFDVFPGCSENTADVFGGQQHVFHLRENVITWGDAPPFVDFYLNVLLQETRKFDGGENSYRTFRLRFEQINFAVCQ